MMKTNQAGIDLIKKYEGFRSKKYLCPAGLPTIGYGHQIRPREKFTTLTPEKAEMLLKDDLRGVEANVTRLVKVGLTDNQFSALASLVYNIGAGKFASSTMLKRLNMEDYAGAANEFDKWVYAGGKRLDGLIARRNSEQELFNNP